MKFHYLQKVKVNDGFYKGIIGNIICYHKPLFGSLCYLISFSNELRCVWFKEFEIEEDQNE